MATRTLPLPRNPHLNLLVYDNGGNLLASTSLGYHETLNEKLMH